MKVYTKTGDQGSTSLVGGERVDKDDSRVTAYGTVDELSAMLAYLRDSMENCTPSLEVYREDILVIIEKLMTVEALLAVSDETQGKSKVKDILDNNISWLESRIDDIDITLKPINYFILPGGHPLISWTHICRTICRRAERTAVRASHEHNISENAIIYLNRLSDYLYLLGRKLTDELGVKENLWIPGK